MWPVNQRPGCSLFISIVPSRQVPLPIHLAFKTRRCLGIREAIAGTHAEQRAHTEVLHTRNLPRLELIKDKTT